MPDNTTDQLASLKKQVLDLQLSSIKQDVIALETVSKARDDDHEKRIRALEETATKVNTLIWLVTGGGLISVVNLYLLLAGLNK